MVTAEQVEAAKATLLQALEEGFDPKVMRAGLDPRFVPPVWKIMLPAAGGHKPGPGYSPTSVAARALSGE